MGSPQFTGTWHIDTHHHFFPSTIPEIAAELKAAKGMVPFKIPETLEDHLAYMDDCEIQTAVLSPSIMKSWEDMSPDDLYELCTRVLKAQLEAVKANPLRFGAFSMLPLPHVEEALKFIDHCSKQEIKPDGYAVSTSHGGKYLGDEAFERIWTTLDKQNATVFVHPTDNVMPEGLKYPPFILEFTFDTARYILNLITSGILTRFPNIRFIFAHNGGVFPFIADRCRIMERFIKAKNNGKGIRDLLASANIFFDTAISSPNQWQLVRELGLPADHIIFASDFPYTATPDGFGKIALLAPKASKVFTAEEFDVGISHGNALKHLFPRLQLEYQKQALK